MDSFILSDFGLSFSGFYNQTDLWSDFSRVPKGRVSPV